MSNFTKNPEVMKITGQIREKAANKDYRVSDVIMREKGKEYQYVDLVLEGGGTLGIALVGYIHALEQADIRFLGMGGSSVGAIVALLAYSCGKRTMEKGEKLAEIISEMNLGDMIDGKYAAKNLSNILGTENVRLRKTQICFNFVFSMRRLFKHLGLNPGDELYNWIAEKLAQNKIEKLEQLNELTKWIPEELIFRRTGERILKYDTRLKMVAADITTGTKVVFPEMAEMYWQDYNEVNPACFARASASIPIFFEPYLVSGISKIIENSEKWALRGSFTGKLPDKVSFADGGLFSNFPIDLFKRPGIPRAPTFGARLGDKDRTMKEIDNLGQYGVNLFNSLRHYADYDFIFKNPLYKNLITNIPTNKYNWLDFNMKPETQLELFKEGVKAGAEFLDRFKWKQYKKQRKAERVIYDIKIDGADFKVGSSKDDYDDEDYAENADGKADADI